MTRKISADHAVQIDQLCINIPGLNPGEAECLGKDVKNLIQRYLPVKTAGGQLKTLHLKIRFPQGTPKKQLAELIARQICEGLP